MEEYLTAYEIQYIDFHSGKLCGSATISPSSCIDGTCISVFYVSTSSCPSDSDIRVIVCNDHGLCNQNPIIIGLLTPIVISVVYTIAHFSL